MKIITPAFLFLGSFLAAGPWSAQGAERSLFREDFTTLASGQHPKYFTWLNFPVPEEANKNNGIVAREVGATENKVLRMFAPAGGGLPVSDDPSFTRAMNDVPEVGSAHRMILQFDYRNLGTAAGLCQIGLRDAMMADSGVAVLFNGSSLPGKGGIYVRSANQKRVYPKGPAGDLQNLAKDVWYRVSLEIDLAEKTMQLKVEDMKSKAVYTTEVLPCDERLGVNTSLNEFIFNFSQETSKANYQFELDNIEVRVAPLG